MLGLALGLGLKATTIGLGLEALYLVALLTFLISLQVMQYVFRGNRIKLFDNGAVVTEWRKCINLGWNWADTAASSGHLIPLETPTWATVNDVNKSSDLEPWRVRDRPVFRDVGLHQSGLTRHRRSTACIDRRQRQRSTAAAARTCTATTLSSVKHTNHWTTRWR